MGRGISKAGGGNSEPRKFSNGEEADAFFAGEFNRWNKRIDDEERDAMTLYTSEAYQSINDYLRSEADEYDPKYQMEVDTIESMDMAIAQFNLKEDITVFRGSGTDILGGNDTVDKVNKNIKGKYIYDDAFLSTSTVKDQAFNGDVLYEINIRKGKGKGAYVDPISEYKGEKEFVVDRTAPLKVKGARKATSQENAMGGYKMVVELEY